MTSLPGLVRYPPSLPRTKARGYWTVTCLRHYGGSWPGSLQHLPGHGPTTDAAGLQRYHRMLVECIDAVRKQIAAGKSLEEIQSAGVPKQWESWGHGFIKTDRWIATIHESLTRK